MPPPFRNSAPGLPAALAQAKLQEAVALHQNGQLDQAQGLYEYVVKKFPGNADALHLLGYLTYQKGDPGRAVELIGKAIKLNPKNPAFHYNRGLILQHMGRLDSAVAGYDRALELRPDDADAWARRGLALQGLGRFEAAAASCERALAIKPDEAEVHANRANMLLALGRPAEALAGYERAVALKPGYADAWSNRGVALKQLGRLDDAIASFGQAIALEPGDAEAHSNRGNALRDMGQTAAALADYDRAIALHPGYAEAHSNRGNALKDLGRPEEALAGYDRAIALKPGYADAQSNRGVALKQLGRLEEALASYAQAIAIHPDRADAYSNRGNALRDLNQPDAALADFDKAIALNPAYAEAHSNRGSALRDLRRMDDAIASFAQAIALNPDFADARLNKAGALLLDGQFAEGFALYEWRWRRGKDSPDIRDFPQALWRGEPSLEGKTLLLHGEQGLGDTIQFSRYAALAAGLGARVVLEIQAPLGELLGGLEGVDQLIARGEPLPAFDYHCPLGSLPLAFKTTPATIPASGGYLRADPGKTQAWSGRLGPKTRPRVGLAWSGSTGHPNDRHRSIPLAALLPFLPDGLDYVSLQPELRPADAEAMAADPRIRHFGEALGDFTDTAALCDLMDVVISVDTSVAHLGGALGRKTWVLLPHANLDWRWLLGRDDSPWYASMKLYRQGADWDWAPVLGKLRQDLTDGV